MTGDDRSHPVGTGHRDEDRVNPEGNHGGRSQLSAYAVDDMNGEQGLRKWCFLDRICLLRWNVWRLIGVCLVLMD
ncbi:hypothetical protein [Corynebacterium glutamicum]|uniref:hypothetical protein n=1 Tax=Corynebacterium glutamicum TaxID=1718 RepID=UPI000943B0C1|nr:hypothetical protein [Corynebacterium glutamicum]